MKIQHYCYTRTNYLDYGDFVLPINLTETELDAIRKKVLSITADVHLQLTTPKWVLIKNKDYIVWGCCCWNRMLAKEKYKDCCGTPVYGFFSIIISDYTLEDVKIPLGIEYFRILYSLEIEPFWDRREEHVSKINDYIGGYFDYISPECNHYVVLLNTNNFLCKSLENVGREKLVKAALTLDNVSLLIDNDNIEQATGQKGSFMNCLSSSVSLGVYPVKQYCSQCKQYVSSFASTGICPDCEKKNEDRIAELKKNEEEMDKRMKKELDEANSKIQYLQLEVEETRKQIKKKDILVKILLGILMLLTFALSYICRDSFSFDLFGEDETLFDKHEVKIESDGAEAFEIEYRTINNNVSFETKAEWIKIIETTPSLKISVCPNNLEKQRDAKIFAKYGEQNKSIVITQRGK